MPSLHERERFCRAASDGHERCPTFRASRAIGAPVPEEIYYRLWLTPRRDEEDERRHLAAL